MKKNLFAIGLVGLGLALTGVGCGTTENSEATPAPAEAPAAAVPIPADSPFAKIKMGMGMDEVYALIGQPSDTGHHITGKAFIPYYYGGDTQRTEAVYKGLGTVVFSPNNHWTQHMGVIEVNYNPNQK
ncbi:MAG: hypothetical protein RL616_1068 [Verrucomicrobiota bacterium]|jgi:hypothetical protein